MNVPRVSFYQFLVELKFCFSSQDSCVEADLHGLNIFGDCANQTSSSKNNFLLENGESDSETQH